MPQDLAMPLRLAMVEKALRAFLKAYDEERWPIENNYGLFEDAGKALTGEHAGVVAVRIEDLRPAISWCKEILRDDTCGHLTPDRMDVAGILRLIKDYEEAVQALPTSTSP